MADVTLREYQPGDWEALYTLDIECFEPAFRFSRRAMRAFAESPNAITLLAESDGKLAGFCIVQIEDLIGLVVTLDVTRAWRRQGLAQRLMKEAEGRVRAAAGIGMTLHVYVDNVGAARFYENIGYTRVELAEEYYRRGLDALVYAKRF